MATEYAVIEIPITVVRQPTVSIMEAGQSTYIRSVPLRLRTPDTPNATRLNTMTQIPSPTRAPHNATERVLNIVLSTRQLPNNKAIKVLAYIPGLCLSRSTLRQV